MRFNKNIFQVWFQGCDKIEKPHFIENIKNWKLINPDWNHMCLADEDLKKLTLMYSQECYDAYMKAKYMHVKIDMGKMVALYIYGGIMVDMDMYSFRSLDNSKIVKEILEEYEKTGEDFVVLGRMAATFSVKLYNNAYCITNKRNGFVKGWIDHVVKRINEVGDGYDNFSYVSLTTGPLEWNKFIYRNTEGGMLLGSKFYGLDSRIFEPCFVNGQCKVGDDTLAVHNFESSWLPGGLKKGVRMVTMNHVMFLYLVIFGLMGVILSMYQRIR